MRKCFTINPNRTPEEIKEYEEYLVKTNIYQGAEIFYPYQKTKHEQSLYKKAVKNFLKYDNFELVCHLPYGASCNLATYQNIEQTMELYEKAIVFAAGLECKKLTLHPGNLDGTLEREVALAVAASNIKELTKLANRYKMTVMIENLVGLQELCLDVKELMELIDLVDEPNIKLIIDCGHYHASKGSSKDLVALVKKVAPFIVHLHLSNNYGERDEHASLVGGGNIDFYSYFAALEEIGYKGLYCSEVLYNSYLDLIETAKQMDSFIPLRRQK